MIFQYYFNLIKKVYRSLINAQSSLNQYFKNMLYII